MKKKDKNEELNSYYTNSILALEMLNLVMDQIEGNISQYYFLDPCAGEGAFFDHFPKNRRTGVDIDKRLKTSHPEYIYHNFLDLNKNNLGYKNIPNKRIVIVGNPPFSNDSNRDSIGSFGRKIGGTNQLYLQILNHSATIGDTIGMIFPRSCRRYGQMQRVYPQLHLVDEIDLGDVIYSKGKTNKDVNVGTVFRIFKVFRDQRGEPILREDQPLLKLDNSGKSTNQDWYVVEFHDPKVNLAIQRWGSTNSVGTILTNPKEIKQVQTQELEKMNLSGKRIGKQSQKYFFIYAPNLKQVS